ncbi:hypothetical protein AVEN_39497-1 [Araneus ventricosus]|uniref:Uncharacterized protein n=1 Tax=Araneus ventricosus TaxID=182803 RepID=A0A4Y2D7V8_ARAVE|nr:hypothetical protein AVEN_39497-1 [Araneus ventricosus]
MECSYSAQKNGRIIPVLHSLLIEIGMALANLLSSISEETDIHSVFIMHTVRNHKNHQVKRKHQEPCGDNHLTGRSEVDRLKSACVQAPVGLHVSLGPPTAADVSEVQWQFSAADRFYVGAGTCASSNCSLYTTNGMLQTGLKPVDTNRCVQGA